MKSFDVYQELGLLSASAASAGVHSGQGERHVFHSHSALWDYCNPALSQPFTDEVEGVELFATLPPGTTMEEAMGRTRFLVFIGVKATEELQAALARTSGVCLVFEPDLERLNDYLSNIKPYTLVNKGVFFVGGNPDQLDVPLLNMLPEDLCGLGYPLFFVQEGLAASLPEYVRRVEELVELFYYRVALYPLESQENVRGLPLRPMVRDVMYDRYKHVYENLEPCLRSGVLSDLLGAFTGHTAILCAAGPALLESMAFIRDNRDRAVVIAVNNALRPLLAAGIEPHFVVINDTSVDSESAFQGLAPLERSILVAHCQSSTGYGIFPRIYFFGNFPGQPFPKRDSLLLHGSVITTAFALAEYMGCTKAVLAGVQLSSPDPYSLHYSKGTVHEKRRSKGRPKTLEGRWPELYPAITADGRKHFTTLNFFDAAQWFADRIRMASLEVINLCPQSILAGPGIVFDPSPKLPEVSGIETMIRALASSNLSSKKERVIDYIRQEMFFWKNKQLAARQGYTDLESASGFIAASDQDNTSFMLQRYGDFKNEVFHEHFFKGKDEEIRTHGAQFFLGWMMYMCNNLLGILIDQQARITGRHGR